MVGRDGDRARRARGEDLGDAGLSGAAREQHQQVDGALRGSRRGLRVDTALEAPGRLGGQLVPTGRTRDRHRVEVRGLDDDVRRGVLRVVVVGDLRVGAAHDTGEPDRAAVVGDHQVLGAQRALDTVEGG